MPGLAKFNDFLLKMLQVFLASKFFTFKQAYATTGQLAGATDHLGLFVYDSNPVEINACFMDFQRRTIRDVYLVQQASNKIFVTGFDLQIME